MIKRIFLKSTVALMLAAVPFIIGKRMPDDPFYDREAMR